MNSAASARKALLALALFAVATGGVAKADEPPENPVIDHLNYYFDHPSSPGAFRALAGEGVAPFDMEKEGVSAVFENWADRGPLMTRLFPSFVAGSYFNPDRCRPDFALQTLQARIAQLGADHPYVARWAEVQRAVFAACGTGEGAAAELPPALTVDDPALAKLQTYDRAYQTASVAFYGEIDRARWLHSAKSPTARLRIGRWPPIWSPPSGQDPMVRSGTIVATSRWSMKCNRSPRFAQSCPTRV